MGIIPLGAEVASSPLPMVGEALRPTSENTSARRSKSWSEWFADLSLPQQFLFGALPVLFGGMMLLSNWMTSRIEQGVIDNAAKSSALYMESLLEPVSRELAADGRVSPATARSLDALLTGTSGGRQIVAMTIWLPDGRVAYSSDKYLIGKSGVKSDELEGAFAGNVRSQYQDTHGDVAALEDKFSIALFEIYAPMRAVGSEQVIAAAEFYQGAASLNRDLKRAKWDTWVVTGGLATAMLSLMYVLVHGAARTIERQRLALTAQVDEQQRLIGVSEDLRQQVQFASRRASELNEQFLRRIGSDLHDGPAQHLALALLKLDELVPREGVLSSADVASGKAALGIVRQATADAMREIRNISTGLALPELQKISPSEALVIAAKAHERATGTPVRVNFQPLPPRLPLPITICLFRFAQEGLNNAYKHAGGKGQALKAAYERGTLSVAVSDEGPGFDVESVSARNDRLGLSGLRYRVESLGGVLSVASGGGSGTRLTVQFDNPGAKTQRG
jgi:signal transduction histidine kinase